MNFIISKELGDAVLSYLGSRPYVEVSELISQMIQLKEAPEAPKAAKNITPEILDEVLDGNK